MIFISSNLFLVGFSCLAVSLLRWRRAPAALPATVALSFFLLPGFPLGTALFSYWFARVRRREAIPQDVSRRTYFDYTVILYVFGLVMLAATRVFQLVLDSAGPENQLLRYVKLGALVVAVATLVTAVVRSTNIRWAYWVTFILNLLLVPWFPLGTGLALGWFFIVRSHEKKLLADLPD